MQALLTHEAPLCRGASLSSWPTRGATTLAFVLVVACHRPAPSSGSPTPFLHEESPVVFDEIDHNGDGRLGFQAFHRGLTVHYYYRQGLDLDGDGLVHPIELATALYELWDANEGGSLDPEEWRRGVSTWFPDRAAVTRLEDWDTNADGTVGMVEFGEGTFRWPLFEPYDASGDGTIEIEEVSRYLHRHWDLNRDGYVDRSEWPLP